MDVRQASEISPSDKAQCQKQIAQSYILNTLSEPLSSLPSDKAQCQNRNVQSYIQDIYTCIKIYKNISLSGDPLSLPAPPPPLRETIFSTEIRSVEYEKSEEQKETVLFDDIGEPLILLVLFDYIDDI